MGHYGSNENHEKRYAFTPEAREEIKARRQGNAPELASGKKSPEAAEAAMEAQGGPLLSMQARARKGKLVKRVP